MSATDELKQAMTDGRVPFSEDDLASRFSTEHADDLRYVEDWRRWLRWDGSRWAQTGTERVFGFARTTCSHAAALCNQPSRKIASAATVAAVERLARSDPRHLTTAAEWNVEPFLLNTPDQLVDLRTGETRPNQPDDMMTKQTAIAPGGGCPLWHNFLARITDSNGELEAFLNSAPNPSCPSWTGKLVRLATLCHSSAVWRPPEITSVHPCPGGLAISRPHRHQRGERLGNSSLAIGDSGPRAATLACLVPTRH